MTEEPLTVLAEVARQRGVVHLADEATARYEREQAGLLFVAVVGQFKRGKTTLINALVGESLLPTAVIPVTSVVTVVRYGGVRTATVVYADGRKEDIAFDALPAFVSESLNPANVKAVRLVDVRVPSATLVGGLCLVDTPGLGSITARSDAITREFIPQVDAALLVVGADPPLSAAELDIAGELARQAERVLTVLNKADKLAASEVAEASAFAEQALTTKAGLANGHIYRVSALEALSTSTREWSALVSEVRLLVDSKRVLTRESSQRTVVRIAHELEGALMRQRMALTQPIEETRQKLGALRERVAELHTALGDVQALSAVEEAKLFRQFDEQQRAFVSAKTAPLREILEARLSAEHVSRAAMRSSAMAYAQEITDDFIRELRASLEPAAEQAYRSAIRRFIQLANGFAQNLISDDDITVPPLSEDVGLFASQRSHVTYLMALTGRGPLVAASQLFLPNTFLRKVVTADAVAYLERLLTTNSARLANDLKDRVGASRKAIDEEIRNRLWLLVVIAEQALARAADVRSRGEDAIAAELRAIDEARSRIEGLGSGRATRQETDPLITD